MDRFVLSQYTIISDKLQGENRINSKNIDFFARESALSNNINTYQKLQIYDYK